LIVVFVFGHEEISIVLLVGLHGFNIKKHVQGGQVVLLLLWGGFRLRGGCLSFGARPSLVFPLSLLLVLSGSLNKTKMSFTVHVLMARTAIDIVAAMPFNVL